LQLERLLVLELEPWLVLGQQALVLSFIVVSFPDFPLQLPSYLSWIQDWLLLC
jgi:hypothetical protein